VSRRMHFISSLFSLGSLAFLVTAALSQDLPVPAQAFTSPSPRGITISPVIKTTTTILGQPLEYTRTDSPEVISVVQTYQPGGETGWHYHLVSSHIYVLEGSLALEVLDGTTEPSTKSFAVGQAYMESVKTWHNARNTGTVPLKLLVVTFGEKDKSNNIFRKAP
jgi:mannose-6-phosphate isomerase-like protein (cupin superfamily)